MDSLKAGNPELKNMSPREVISFAQEKEVKIVDLKFTDLIGTWQHFSISTAEFNEDLFRQGIGFDGSSIRGFQEIQESDMLLLPDPNTAIIDPFCEAKTLSLTCNVLDPITRKPYSRDPRFIAQKAEHYLRANGIADVSYWGPEAEFYIFNDIRYYQNEHSAYYFIDSEEGIWNSGRLNNGKLNLGHRPRFKEGYFPVPPADSLQNIRSEMILTMIQSGIQVEVHHHEVGGAGQAEIDMRFAPLTKMADQMMLYKYIVKNVSHKHNMTATFMPKPIFQDNGSGMHTHQSLWKGGRNLFYSPDGYSYLSQEALWYIGGLLKHAPALCALIAPTTNSYRRLVPGFEAPVKLAYSERNRSACVRIPTYFTSENSKRVEFRTPDPSCNPYLAFAAMLMAGLDGIKNKIDPGMPLDKNLYELSVEEEARVKSTPGTLEEALNLLEEDHQFLLEGRVFTQDVIDFWLDYKRKKEVDQMRLRPHPWEFYLYYDA